MSGRSTATPAANASEADAEASRRARRDFVQSEVGRKLKRLAAAGGQTKEAQGE